MSHSLHEAARPRVADPHRCPSCGSSVTQPRCLMCGVLLSGALAVQVWHASQEADKWLDIRERLIHELRGEAQLAAMPAPVGQPAHVVQPNQPAPSGPPAVEQPAPFTQPSARQDVVARPPQRRRAIGVQDLLVGLGALLLAVAAVVFLAFSWDRLGISGRSAVVGALTVAVLGGAMLARRARMGATAEAVAAFGAVLVVLDAVAVRASGLVGEPVGWLAYASGAAAICVLVLAAVGSLGRLRAPVFAAALVAPVAPVAAGFSLAMDASTSSGTVVLGALGLLGGAAVATARPLLVRRGLVAEAVTLEGVAYALVTLTVLAASVSAATGLLGAAALVMLAVAALATAMTLTSTSRSLWSVVAERQQARPHRGGRSTWPSGTPLLSRRPRPGWSPSRRWPPGAHTTGRRARPCV